MGEVAGGGGGGIEQDRQLRLIRMPQVGGELNGLFAEQDRRRVGGVAVKTGRADRFLQAGDVQQPRAGRNRGGRRRNRCTRPLRNGFRRGIGEGRGRLLAAGDRQRQRSRD